MPTTSYSRRPARLRTTAATSRIGRRVRRIPTALILLLVAGALQSLAWNVALPAFQGPDENAHFAYVQYLAETGHVPSATAGSGSYSKEVQLALSDLNLTPLMGNLEMKPGWSNADLRLWHRSERLLTAKDRGDGSGPNPIAKNPPLYYGIMAVPYRVFIWLPLLKRLFVMRLCNACFFLLTIAFTWLLAGEIFARSRWKQTLATGAVALLPQLAFMSAVINADNLLIALFTGFTFAAVRLARRGPTTRRLLLAGAFSAGAVLTQGRGLVTVPVLLVAIGVSCARFRPQWRATVRDVVATGALVVVALAIGYLVQRSGGGGALYGGQASSLNSQPFSVTQFASFAYQFFFPKLTSMAPRIGPAYGYRQVFINTFFASFGWLEVTFHSWVYDVLEVVAFLGLLGMYTALVARWRSVSRAWAPFTVLVTLLVVQVVFLLYVSYQALLGDGGTDPLIAGRYLLPIVGLFGLAIAFTIGSLPRRVGPLVGSIVLSAEVLLSIAGIALTASRFYG